MSTIVLASLVVLHSDPFTPQDERATYRFADTNLTVELVAAEPDVVSPVAMAWDADGRLFVAEMNDYPLSPEGGRVRLLQNPDGRGHYARVSVFAERLPFPTSVLPWNGGVLVAAAPNIWFLKDTDGDGQADERRVLWTGFGEGNQQLRVNGLQWGLDNWVYGANGRSDGEVRKPGDPLGSAVSLRGHDFRFQPDTGQFEALAGRSQFGTPRDDWGTRFLSWNTIPIRQVVMEERYLSRNPYLATTESLHDLLPGSDTKEVFPLTPAPLVFNEESSSHFNALAGLTIYRGDALGADPMGREYHGNAFMGESLRNLVHRRVLVPQGPTFEAERGENGREFLASTDPWFHPVNFTTGPDGALYIADFYRRFVEHPHYVHDPSVVDKVPWREGAGHGRIWRVVRRESPDVARRESLSPALAGRSTSELVKYLGSSNGWIRDTVQRLFVERKDRGAPRFLRELVLMGPSPLAKVHALWTLDGLGALDGRTLVAGLSSSEPRVREAALGLAPEHVLHDSDVQSTALNLANDPDPRVRLQAAILMGNLADVDETSTGAVAALARLARIDLLDRWQVLAILSGAGKRAWPLFLELVTHDPQWLAPSSGAAEDFIERAAQIIATRGNPNEVKQGIAWLLKSEQTEPQPGRLIFAAGLAEGLAQRHLGLRDWIIQEGAGTASERTILDSLFQSARQTASSSSRLQLVAVRILGEADAAFAGGALLDLLAPRQPVQIQSAVAQALARLNNDPLAREAFSRWSGYSRPARQALIAASPNSTVLSLALLDSIATQGVSIMEVDATTRAALLKATDSTIRTRAEKYFNAAFGGDRQAVIRSFQPALEHEGDRQHGAEVFAKTCLICHAVKGKGSQVGPDLSAVGTRPKEALLNDILDPSQTVSPDFLSYTVQTTDGQSLTGLLLSETAANVTLRRSQQPDETIARSRIKELRADGKSLMPDGLEQGLTPQDLADLLAFLRNPDPALLPTN